MLPWRNVENDRAIWRTCYLACDSFQFIVWLGVLVLEQVGESTENPFEGCTNDLPITQISRNIEIDLREMLREKELPLALQPVKNILM